jgi:hypothetical protein
MALFLPKSITVDISLKVSPAFLRFSSLPQIFEIKVENEKESAPFLPVEKVSQLNQSFTLELLEIFSALGITSNKKPLG